MFIYFEGEAAGRLVVRTTVSESCIIHRKKYTGWGSFSARLCNLHKYGPVISRRGASNNTV